MSEDNRNFTDELNDEVRDAIKRMPLEEVFKLLVKTHDFDFGDATLFFSARQGPVAKKYAEYAHEHYTDEGELEIDDAAIVSLGCDSGAYVMAWQWVDANEAGVTELEQAEEMVACTET